MRRLLYAALLLPCLALGACMSAPLPKVSHNKAVTTAAAQTGRINLTSGTVSGSNAPVTVPVSGAFITIPGGSSPNWANFNMEDQMGFVINLDEELQRLNILVQAPPSQKPDMTIDLRFNSTSRAPNNDYTLNVTAKFATAAGSREKQYVVRAFEGEEFWARFNVTPATGKKMAAQKLLDAVIPDIETALAAK